MSRLFVLFVFCGFAGCGYQSPPVVIHPVDHTPERLSEWGIVLSDGDYVELNESVLPYQLNTPLFTDYALKLRAVWMPSGESADYDASREFDFPIGTILSKTFHYEKADDWSEMLRRVVRSDREAALDERGRLDLARYDLIETRLLVRYEDGWRAYPYVWNKAQDEAWLEVAGDIANLSLIDGSNELEFLYVVPDANQCAGCHAPDHTNAEIRPIGPKARHLNRDRQIEHWGDVGVLRNIDEELPASGGSLEDRARAYLDINCAHCHNSAGAADTSGLHLNIEAPLDRNFGLCKSPTAVGQGSGDRLYDIFPGKPEESILVYRMNHIDPAIAMPELGRSTVHAEGVSLVSEWIGSLEGGC